MPVWTWAKFKVTRVKGATLGVVPHTLLVQRGKVTWNVMAVDPRKQVEELVGAEWAD